MNTHYPTIDEPATPEYVLAVLRDDYRQQCQYDPEAEPDVDLTFETTVAEWRNACDLVGTHDLGRAENEVWGIHRGDDEWRAILEPAKARTLGDVCGADPRGHRLPPSDPPRPTARVELLRGPPSAFLDGSDRSSPTPARTRRPSPRRRRSIPTPDTTPTSSSARSRRSRRGPCPSWRSRGRSSTTGPPRSLARLGLGRRSASVRVPVWARHHRLIGGCRRSPDGRRLLARGFVVRPPRPPGASRLRRPPAPSATWPAPSRATASIPAR